MIFISDSISSVLNTGNIHSCSFMHKSMWFPWGRMGNSDDSDERFFHPQILTWPYCPYGILTLNFVIKVGMDSGECEGFWHPTMINGGDSILTQFCLCQNPQGLLILTPLEFHINWSITYLPVSMCIRATAHYMLLCNNTALNTRFRNISDMICIQILVKANFCGIVSTN